MTEASPAFLISYLEDIAERLSRPTVRDLETGFRHSPLSIKEKAERALETCQETAEDIRWIVTQLQEHLLPK